MKNVILFIMLLVGFVVTAQTVTLPTMAAAANNPAATAQLVTTDYTLSAATVRYFIYSAPQPKPTTQDFVIELDTVAGTQHTTVSVQLQGQKSSLKGDWTNIGSAVVWHSTADTIIVISNATANRFSNYRVGCTGVGTGAVSKVDNQWLKLYLE